MKTIIGIEPGDSLLCISCHDCLPYVTACDEDLNPKELCANCLHEKCGEDGESCPVGLGGCVGCQNDAHDAGIPWSVIKGKTRMSDHFSPSQIARECGRISEADELDNQDLRDAGRGHLVRR